MKRILGLICGFLLLPCIVFGAENITVTAGSGTTIAMDDVAGVKYQQTKLVESTADSTTPTGVAANPLQVSLANTAANGTAVAVSVATVPSHAVTNAGTFATQVDGAALTALQLIDNAISGAGFNITQVNGETIDVGAGTEAASIRVTLPTDGTGVVKLGAGTAEIGKLAAGTANIGDVDIVSGTVTTVSTVTNLSQLGGVAIDMGTGTRGSGTQRVTIATNDAVPVTFTGSTDAATQTTLAAINTKLATGTVIGDVNLGATDNAVLDNITTSVQLQDDTVATLGSAIVAKGTQVAGLYDSTTPTAIDDGDAVTVLTDQYGRLLTGVNSQNFTSSVTVTSASPATVYAGTASRKMYITSLLVSASAACNITIYDDAATPLIRPVYLAANGGFAMTYPPETPLVTTAVNQALVADSSTADAYSVTVTGYLAP